MGSQSSGGHEPQERVPVTASLSQQNNFVNELLTETTASELILGDAEVHPSAVVEPILAPVVVLPEQILRIPDTRSDTSFETTDPLVQPTIFTKSLPVTTIGESEPKGRCIEPKFENPAEKLSKKRTLIATLRVNKRNLPHIWRQAPPLHTAAQTFSSYSTAMHQPCAEGHELQLPLNL